MDSSFTADSHQGLKIGQVWRGRTCPPWSAYRQSEVSSPDYDETYSLWLLTSCRNKRLLWSYGLMTCSHSVGTFSVSNLKFDFKVTQSEWDSSLQIQVAFFVFICFIFMVVCVHVNSVFTCLNLTGCSSVWLSLHAPSPRPPITLHPCSSPTSQSLKMYVSCQLVTWLSQHTFYVTCYPLNTHLELEEVELISF